MIAVLWIAAATYVLISKDVALPAGNKEPKQPPLASLSLSSNAKNVAYEVLAPAGQEVTVSYLDEKAQTQLFSGPAPWRSIVTTRDIGFAAGVTALSKNGPLTCRIKVDDQTIDEKTDGGSDPSVSCNLVGFQKLPL
ncbi:MAG: MmpS family transport accessory protein [Segniliparus sp.]|uniref:MmpS family transport accessory protein n=1 Tax=Segniliparus sp. TaxID=2804064 RepID=UPI003F3E36D4